ncbi:MAG: hypothetical protein G01um101418_622 [Parcubacteria group bacterium Gr01-1014_18]|nr:MAG: hypothetical protein Greene041636_87 [Parcubacteria group bacterium Greene0416_36]TSC80874.1 MAG: hypothetical protein G01um101418_622 [Parcubacteria group bacterium Gr01-1014_18]TSC99535.1 MAG: hypothetical protein Greene101420_202 [Parcubacteria group bacterium Greene1014_20]TSD07546.1 MAG: hypothetical protein Greene07142_3 [Parcubacteria group bacterium Greene0714_2]
MKNIKIYLLVVFSFLFTLSVFIIGYNLFRFYFPATEKKCPSLGWDGSGNYIECIGILAVRFDDGIFIRNLETLDNIITDIESYSLVDSNIFVLGKPVTFHFGNEDKYIFRFTRDSNWHEFVDESSIPQFMVINSSTGDGYLYKTKEEMTPEDRVVFEEVEFLKPQFDQLKAELKVKTENRSKSR